jgi:hypothetical protein
MKTAADRLRAYNEANKRWPLPISSKPRLGDQGQRQMMVNHPNRSKKTRTIRFTQTEIITIKRALTIASEDGSIYGGSEPGDGEYEAQDAEIDTILRKLDEAA